MPNSSTVSSIIEQFADQPILDDEQLEMLTIMAEEEGDDLINELIGLFKEESGSIVEDLTSICVNHDLVEFRKKIHFVAGSAGNIGLKRLNLTLRKIEESLDEGRLTDLSGADTQIRALYRESVAYIAGKFKVQA